MHTLLEKALHLKPEDIEIEEAGVNTLFKINNHGVLKKKPFRDVFLLKKFKHPIIDQLKTDTLAGYASFSSQFNRHFKQNYNINVVLPSKCSDITEHFEFNFINGNRYELFYVVQLSFKGEANYSDTITVRYVLVDGIPVKCFIDFNMCQTDGFYRHSSKVMEFTIEIPYYQGQHMLTLAYVYKNFLDIIEETFENFDNFVYNIDNNLDILIMQIF